MGTMGSLSGIGDLLSSSGGGGGGVTPSTRKKLILKRYYRYDLSYKFVSARIGFEYEGDDITNAQELYNYLNNNGVQSDTTDTSSGAIIEIPRLSLPCYGYGRYSTETSNQCCPLCLFSSANSYNTWITLAYVSTSTNLQTIDIARGTVSGNIDFINNWSIEVSN